MKSKYWSSKVVPEAARSSLRCKVQNFPGGPCPQPPSFACLHVLFAPQSILKLARPPVNCFLRACVVVANVVVEGISFTHFPIVTCPSQWRMRTTHQSARGVAVHFMLHPTSVSHQHGTGGNVMCNYVTTVILPSVS